MQLLALMLVTSFKVLPLLWSKCQNHSHNHNHTFCHNRSVCLPQIMMPFINFRSLFFFLHFLKIFLMYPQVRRCEGTTWPNCWNSSYYCWRLADYGCYQELWSGGKEERLLRLNLLRAQWRVRVWVCVRGENSSLSHTHSRRSHVLCCTPAQNNIAVSTDILLLLLQSLCLHGVWGCAEGISLLQLFCWRVSQQVYKSFNYLFVSYDNSVNVCWAWRRLIQTPLAGESLPDNRIYLVNCFYVCFCQK